METKHDEIRHLYCSHNGSDVFVTVKGSDTFLAFEAPQGVSFLREPDGQLFAKSREPLGEPIVTPLEQIEGLDVLGPLV